MEGKQKPLNCSEGKTCKTETGKWRSATKAFIHGCQGQQGAPSGKKWSSSSAKPDSVKWDWWAWEIVLTFLENCSCFCQITWLSFHNCFSVALWLTASINYKAMFRGTSAKLQNGVDIVPLHSCILDINIQTIFVTFAMEIRNIMKLLMLSLDLCRLPELNKI